MTPEGLLIKAIRENKVQEAADVIRRGADLSSCRIGSQLTLEFAASSGKREMSKLLADNGEDPNLKYGAQQTTLLHRAVNNSNFAMLSILLELGANPNLKSRSGATPLHLATQNGHEFMVIKLLKNKAEVDAQDNKGRTPLLLAVAGNESKIAKRLLQAGCDANLADKRGVSPLAIAAKGKNNELVTLLLNHGALETSDQTTYSKRVAEPSHRSLSRDV